MKHLIPTILLVLTFTVHTPEAQALFGHVEAEKARREHAEQHLTSTQQQLGEQQQLANDQQRVIDGQQQAVVEEHRLTNKWQTTAFVFGVSAVITLIVGTAIGSRGRRHAAAGK